MLVNQTWRREPCLADCGEWVKRSRNSWAEVIGTRTGSWICAQASAIQFFSDPLPPPLGEKLTILGVAHISCLDKARELLKAGTLPAVSDKSPAVLIEWGHRLSRYDFGAPASPSECPFCQFSRSGLTDEDVTPKWMIKYLLGRARLNGKASRLLKRGLTRVVSVCRDCNNTWMSTLEKDIQPCLISMFEHTTLVGRQEQALPAKWATISDPAGSPRR